MGAAGLQGEVVAVVSAVAAVDLAGEALPDNGE